MPKYHSVAIAAGFLLAVSGPSFAAKRMSTKSGVKSQFRAAQFGSAETSGSATRPYERNPYLYDRDDPYAPGVNWPGHW